MTSVAAPTIPPENLPFAFQVVWPTLAAPASPIQLVVVLESEASAKDQKYEEL